MARAKIAFVQATPLTNVRGRVNYISNPKRQEYLLGFYQTPEDPKTFWRELAKTSQQHAKYKKGNLVCEAREHIVQIPNHMYYTTDHNELARELAEKFKEKYGVECAVGIHLNKARTNYHAHVVFAERKQIQDRVDREPAKRNTYFDELGRRSTKAKCTDENGKLKKGCRLVKKGESFHTEMFGAKDEYFRSKQFLREEKQRYAELWTEKSKGKGQIWEVYDPKKTPYLRLHNHKRGESEGLKAWKDIENRKIRAYNRAIEELIESEQITVDQALDIKKRIYSQLEIDREKNKINRERRIRMYNDRFESQQAYARERALRNAMYYREDGERRGLIEALVILAMVVVGFDMEKVFGLDDWREDFPEEDLRQEEIIIVPASAQMQAMSDAMFLALGRRPPSEILAEKRVQRMAEMAKQNSTSTPIGDRKPGLDDVIAGAEAEKPQHPRRSSSPERDWPRPGAPDREER